MQTPWQFTTWLDLLDHWQSLAAGLVALVAAVIAVGGGEFFARQKERREAAAIRASLSAEIRQYINLLFETHGLLARFAAGGARVPPSSLRTLTEIPEPTVYPATADRIGHLGSLAADVSGFYSNIERVKFAAKMVADELGQIFIDPLVGLLKQACQNSLPLFSALPINDADLKAKIEGMSKP